MCVSRQRACVQVNVQMLSFVRGRHVSLVKHDGLRGWTVCNLWLEPLHVRMLNFKMEMEHTFIHVVTQTSNKNMTGHRKNPQLILPFVPSFAPFLFSVLAFLMCTFYHKEAIMVGRVNGAEQGGSVYFMVWQTRAFIKNVKVYSFCFFPCSWRRRRKKKKLCLWNILSHPPPWSPLQVAHSQLQHTLDGLAPLCCQHRLKIVHHLLRAFPLFSVSFQPLHFPLCQLLYFNFLLVRH